MSHYFYITPEEYAKAAEHGIKPKVVDNRVRLYGWEKERALTQPMKQPKNRKKWRELAEKNGILYGTFMSRLAQGWSEERAATQPLQSKAESVACVARARDAQRRYPAELFELAKKNGIPKSTFYYRVKTAKWSPEEAATKPLLSKSETAKRYRWNRRRQA
jgi:hypothetical protein